MLVERNKSEPGPNLGFESVFNGSNKLGSELVIRGSCEESCFDPDSGDGCFDPDPD